MLIWETEKVCPEPPDKWLRLFFMFLVIPPSHSSRDSLKGEGKHFENPCLLLYTHSRTVLFIIAGILFLIPYVLSLTVASRLYQKKKKKKKSQNNEKSR